MKTCFFLLIYKSKCLSYPLQSSCPLQSDLSLDFFIPFSDHFSVLNQLIFPPSLSLSNVTFTFYSSFILLLAPIRIPSLSSQCDVIIKYSTHNTTHISGYFSQTQNKQNSCPALAVPSAGSVRNLQAVLYWVDLSLAKRSLLGAEVCVVDQQGPAEFQGPDGAAFSALRSSP